MQFLGARAAQPAAVAVLLAARDEALEQIAHGALEAMGEPAELAIDEVWSDLEADARRARAASSAAPAARAAATRLCEALDDPDPAVRVAAARSLAARALPRGRAAAARDASSCSAGDVERELSEEELAAR